MRLAFVMFGLLALALGLPYVGGSRMYLAANTLLAGDVGLIFYGVLRTKT